MYKVERKSLEKEKHPLLKKKKKKKKKKKFSQDQLFKFDLTFDSFKTQMLPVDIKECFLLEKV